MSDFKIRKPRRDIDIYDYYYGDREEKNRKQEKEIALGVEAE